VHAWCPGIPDDQVPAAAGTIQLVLAFHLTLKRALDGTPTIVDPVGSAPTRRWWALTVGCEQHIPAPPGLYPIVKARLISFYKNLVSHPAERLVILDDFWNAVPNPAVVQVDDLYNQMVADPDVTLVPIPPHASYGPYIPICPSGQLKGVRIIYTGP
jgi:hypothetical protein